MDAIAGTRRRSTGDDQIAFYNSTNTEERWIADRGAGKTHAIVASALRHTENGAYRALLIGPTVFDEMAKQAPALGGSLWGPSVLSGLASRSARLWVFPSGACVSLGNHDDDPGRYRGHQYHFAGIDDVESCPAELREVVRFATRLSGNGIPLRYRETG